MSVKRASELLSKKPLTASDFVSVWYEYDKEGTGFIQGQQLDNFLRDFITKSSESTPNEAQIDQMKENLMNSADENKDGKLEICEVAKILPLDESFLLLFRFNCPLNSSIEFMKIWKKYDKNGDGSLDKRELKEFLRDFHRQAKKSELDDTKTNDYSDAVIKLFDRNKDGMLQISEMTKLLPVEHNFLKRLDLQRNTEIKKKDVEKIFTLYDKDNNGFIQETEIDGFLKDLLEYRNKTCNFEDLKALKETILQNVEEKKVSRNDMKIILQALLAGENDSISLFQRFKKRLTLKRVK